MDPFRVRHSGFNSKQTHIPMETVVSQFNGEGRCRSTYVERLEAWIGRNRNDWGRQKVDPLTSNQ